MQDRWWLCLDDGSLAVVITGLYLDYDITPCVIIREEGMLIYLMLVVMGSLIVFFNLLCLINKRKK